MTVLELVVQDIQALPKSALQLVAAHVSINEGIPAWLSGFVMAQLAKRVDINVVSPAAQAETVMRRSAFGPYIGFVYASDEIKAQFEILKALAMIDKVLVAAAFVSTLADRITGIQTTCQRFQDRPAHLRGSQTEEIYQ